MPDATEDTSGPVAPDAALDAGADAPDDAPIGPWVDATPDAPLDGLAPDAAADGSPDAFSPADASFSSPTVLVSNVYTPREIAVAAQLDPLPHDTSRQQQFAQRRTRLRLGDRRQLADLGGGRRQGLGGHSP